MTTDLNWSSVEVRTDIKPEFGACHAHYAWRRHMQDKHKFASLENAFCSRKNSIPRLLQNPRGNANAAAHPERGDCLYAAVWYPDSGWAILCNPRSATLVPRKSLEEFPVIKMRDEHFVDRLRELFNSSAQTLRRELNEKFYVNVIE